MHPKNFRELSPDDLCRAIESTHKCTAHFQYWQHVEVPYGAVWWLGGIGVFRLVGHPDAVECYAWSWSGTDTDQRRVYTVPRVPPTMSPGDAVSATLARSGVPAECAMKVPRRKHSPSD